MRELIDLLDSIEHKAVADTVVSQIRARVKQRNLFGWRTYIEDVIIDTVSYMIATEWKYSVGGYIQVGMTSALTKCRYCNATKRKPFYETVSLDSEDVYIQLADSGVNIEEQVVAESSCDILLQKIAAQYGEELATQLKPVIFGEVDKLSSDIIKKCKQTDIYEFLRRNL